MVAQRIGLFSHSKTTLGSISGCGGAFSGPIFTEYHVINKVSPILTLVCRCSTGLLLFSRSDRPTKGFCVLDCWLDKRCNFKKPLDRLTDFQHHLSVIKITVHYSPDWQSNANESGSVLLPLLWEAFFFFSFKPKHWPAGRISGTGWAAVRRLHSRRIMTHTITLEWRCGKRSHKGHDSSVIREINTAVVNTGPWRTLDLQNARRRWRSCRCGLHTWNAATILPQITPSSIDTTVKSHFLLWKKKTDAGVLAGCLRAEGGLFGALGWAEQRWKTLLCFH